MHEREDQGDDQMILEKGRICLKTAGREAGKYCVIIGAEDETFVIVTGPKVITRVKRRKCNILQLEPTEHMLDINSGSDADVESAWKSSGLIEQLNIELPKFRTVPKTKK